MNAVDFEPVLSSLEDLFSELHPVIVKHWGDDTVASIKPDGSLVTIVDKLVEERLTELFSAILPQAFFLGEESYDPSPEGQAAILRHELLIVVDPIDGTRNYVEGNVEFGTLIGIYQQLHGRFIPRFGVVYRPVLDALRTEGHLGTVTFSTAKGIAAHNLMREPGESSLKKSELPLESPSAPGTELRVVTSHHPTAFTEKVRIIRSDVSITDLMLPLSGEADATICRSRFWDIAGPVALAKNTALNVYSLSSGVEIESFSLEDFIPSGPRKWELKEPILLASPASAARVLLR